MKRLALLLSLILLLPLLSGFKLLQNPYRKWASEDLPIQYFVGDQPPFGLTNEQARQLLVESYANWENVECSPLVAEFAGDIPNQPTFNNSSQTIINHEGNMATGVNAAAVTHAGNRSIPYNGTPFRNITAMNLIFNSGIRWGTPEDVRAPGCFNVNSYEATATHEIGHGMGFGHSCDDGEACPAAASRLATMYWVGARCDGSREDLNEDDVAAVQAAYGVAVDFTLEAADGGGVTFGPVPLAVHVEIPEDYTSQQGTDGGLRFDEFEINFGDGSDHALFTNDGSLIAVDHSYTREGQFTVSVVGRGSDSGCGGDFSARARKVGDILACAPPEASFDYQDLGENTLEMVNTTPVAVFGCVTDFRWILDGDEGSSISTFEPKWTFDSPGSHTITLRASGPAGSTEASQSVEVTQLGAGCSASVAGRAGGWLLLLLPLGVLRKRR